MSIGKVFLVGAGPGDLGLITVRGVQCLGQCDVVVYDHLANEGLLAHVPPGAEQVYVGKSSARHTMSQTEINDLLVRLAGEGRRVVRLKGGDPFVFGRGGEEAACLASQGIEFEVVPGVSSALAVPAYAGIPVTQRGMNVALHIVAGHEDPDKGESGIDWETLARSEGTLVFLMGVSSLGRIAHELTSRGKPARTPVALIRWGTLPEQETLVSTLGEVAGEAQRRGFMPPAVIVVGEVVGLREVIQWAERRPLFGVRVALTRPVEQSRALAERLSAAGADVLVTPTIEVVARKLSPLAREAIGAVSSYHWVVFTSANGVRIFFDYLYEMRLDARALAKAHVAAIGEKTAETLRSFGIIADTVPREYVQEGLAQALRVRKGQRVLIPRAAVARDVLERELESRGARVHVVPVYDTIPDRQGIARLKQQLTRGRVHLVTFTSSSTVSCLAESVKSEDLPRLFSEVVIASIGPVTTKTLVKSGLSAQIEAKSYTADGLAEAILGHYRKGGGGDEE